MKKTLGLFFLVLLAISMTLSGCGKDGIFSCHCNDEIDDLIADHGNPEEINKYDSKGYHSHTYWYWCKGFSRTFTWGSNVKGCCEVSTYTFSPICK